MSAVQETNEQPTSLLEPLRSTYMVLCAAISKMDRKSYCTLYRSNRSMANFMESYHSTIKPNLLMDETVTFEDHGFALSSGYFTYEETEDQGDFSSALRNLFNEDGKNEIDDGPKKSLEFISVNKRSRKVISRLPKKEFIHMFKGAKPKRIVWNSFAEDGRPAYNCLKELEFTSDCSLELSCYRMDSFARVGEILKPKELLMSKFFSNRRRNMCDHLEHPLFKTLDSLTIGYLDFHGPQPVQNLPPGVLQNFLAQLFGGHAAGGAGAGAAPAAVAPANNAGAPAVAVAVNNAGAQIPGALAAPAPAPVAAAAPANNNNNDDEEEEEGIPFHFCGLLEHLKVFEVTTTLNERAAFEYKELRQALKNWCAGKNRLERISIRNIEKPNDFPLYRDQDLNQYYRERTMRILNREEAPRWVPEMFNVVHSVNALSVSFHQLPEIMKEAIHNEQYTFGRTTKDEDEMIIRLLLCPSKKKMAYVYTSAWGEFAFRAFNFYPKKK